MKILVVDDTQEARDKLSNILSEMPEVELIGTAAFALSGAMIAIERKLDLFGVLIAPSIFPYFLHLLQSEVTHVSV